MLYPRLKIRTSFRAATLTALLARARGGFTFCMSLLFLLWEIIVPWGSGVLTC